MLLLKRLLTSLVLLIVLFVFLFVGSLAIGGAIAGARVGGSHPEATDFQSGYEVGQRAGAEFARNYRGILFIGALSISALTALTISFSGILPWCRKPRSS